MRRSGQGSPRGRRADPVCVTVSYLSRDCKFFLTLPRSCPVPGEIFNPYWQNETCSPFTPANVSCELGNRAVYSINVSGHADVQAGLNFATKNNVRLVIRNTGIE